MDYLSSLFSKWMPEQTPVAVDSHPRLSGIMDTINSTLAHGEATRLPAIFYDPKGREIIDKIGVEEWFSGYNESTEYRTVGIGGLVGDLVSRMVGNVEQRGNDGLLEIGGDDGDLGKGRGGEKGIKFALSGCHDTTLAAILSSLGAFEDGKWPPYTSHIAIELFKHKDAEQAQSTDPRILKEGVTAKAPYEQNATFKQRLFGSGSSKGFVSKGISRKPLAEFTAAEHEKLKGRYVRLRYNDRPVTIPGCRLPGNHLDGDESFCTLVSPQFSLQIDCPCSCFTGGFQSHCRQVYPKELERGLPLQFG